MYPSHQQFHLILAKVCHGIYVHGINYKIFGREKNFHKINIHQQEISFKIVIQWYHSMMWSVQKCTDMDRHPKYIATQKKQVTKNYGTRAQFVICIFICTHFLPYYQQIPGIIYKKLKPGVATRRRKREGNIQFSTLYCFIKSSNDFIRIKKKLQLKMD